MTPTPPTKHDLQQLVVIVTGLLFVTGVGAYLYMQLGEVGVAATVAIVLGTASTTVGLIHYGRPQHHDGGDPR